MKKFMLRAIMPTFLASVLCTTSYAATISTSTQNGTVTVNITGLTAGEESTFLAVTAGTALSDVVNNTTAVQYIDQMTVKSDGTSTFSFDIGDVKNIDVYSGYTSMAANAEPLKSEIKEKNDDSDPTPTPGTGFIYGDVNGDKEIDLLDAGEIIAYYYAPTMVKFTDATYGLAASDVNGDEETDLLDAGFVINKYFYPDTTIFPAETKTQN